MASDRHLQELAARCVDCMVFYQNGHRTPKAKAQMVSDVRAVARSIAGLKLVDEVRVEHLETPVRVGLVDRYGPESGQALSFVSSRGRSRGRSPRSGSSLPSRV